MTTKDDEREALEQVKKILAGLGKDSYLAAAIDPYVLQTAADNIDNDFSCSPSDRIKGLEADLQQARIDLQTANENKEQYKAGRDEWQKKAEKLEKRLEETQNNLQIEKEYSLDYMRERDKAEIALEEANKEITRLKAALYDYMTSANK